MSRAVQFREHGGIEVLHVADVPDPAVPEAHPTRKPREVSWEQAGALKVAGATAYASVHAVALRQGDVVVVSGAAGGSDR